MSDKKLNLKVITPSKILIDEEVEAVYTTAVDGEFGVLPDHISMMTSLGVGVTKFIKNGKPNYAATIGGIFQVENNNVTILTDSAELGEEIDLTRAKAAKERAEARLGIASKEIDQDRAQIAISRALARIKTASMSGGKK
jgi:F-type H+-transporting ATPase subunit epsilon